MADETQSGAEPAAGSSGQAPKTQPTLKDLLLAEQPSAEILLPKRGLRKRRAVQTLD